MDEGVYGHGDDVLGRLNPVSPRSLPLEYIHDAFICNFLSPATMESASSRCIRRNTMDILSSNKPLTTLVRGCEDDVLGRLNHVNPRSLPLEYIHAAFTYNFLLC